ncbi:Transglutaminase-like enzyme, putative cysteine protease [Halomicrobium zhouii]|uniref:Transglutaminase-like enzyme, putative cysteine protease n=1 Tax=Halomicrobium zhouii TaxID=767519 RepID=A0A1I6KCY0_9EURY|nr:transglutaminaseTgpA domain-containing protein [Halomicrobium zhouii]SFR89079.1 Transglutaminase-like enzyme, putative cysteine protease [Halomicrobium zhouii]
MSTDDSPFPDLDGSRDYSRVLLVLVSLLAVLVASSALPVLAPAGTQSPVESLVPIPAGSGGGGGVSTAGPGGGSMGALSPGQQTNVGGSLGGQNALQSQNAEIHFVVRSTDPAYWRTGAYGNYTGVGWRQDGETRPYNGSIETRGPDGREVTYEVELNRTARSLPTVWRPETVSRENLLVTDGGAVQAEAALGPGTTYRGVSDRPPSDENLLRTAGTDYPTEIEERYTQLPASTEGRLGAKTSQITDGASTPYERATRIEAWLESNKEYSLNVSRPPDDDVASEFVFEMDAGYCEYFATSMVAMLRSQDVPARYVVGYSTGQPVDEDTYTVRGMNAHAWVEVYFPDVGWVQFDPTPASERLQQEQESLENQTGESFETPSPEATPTPGATPTPDDTDGSTGTETADGSGPATPTGTPTDTPTPTGSTDGEGDETGPGSGDGEGGGDGTADRQREAGEYFVTLNRSAAPGATVEVTVRDGRLMPGVTVLFNGESIGQTGPDGTVVGEVPYAEQLNVSVVDAQNAGLVAPVVPRGEDGRLFAVDGVQANASTTFTLSTNATVTVTGDAVTGETVTVTAFVDDVPVRDAPVTLDGEEVARTNRDGRADVKLPTEPGNVTLAVERGSVTGETTLDLARLNVTTEPTAPLALPFTGVAVDATVDGDPAPGANVIVDGERVATTGVDGTATATLPFASGATVEVTKYGQRRGTTYDGLFLNLGLVGLAVGLLVGGVVAAAGRYDVDPSSGRHWAWLAGQWVVGAVVAVGGAADTALARLAERARLTVDHLRALVEGRRDVADLLDALRAWLRDRVAEARTPVEDLGVASVVSNGDDGGYAGDAHATIRESWGRFLDAVSIRRPHTRTPGEIAAHAVAVDGLPEAEVERLRDAFRAVEYGQRDPDERAPGVESAAEAIEAAVEAADAAAANDAGDGDATDGDGTDGDAEADPSGTDAGVAD